MSRSLHNRIRRILTVVTAALMIITMVVPVWAEETESGSNGSSESETQQVMELVNPNKDGSIQVVMATSNGTRVPGGILEIYKVATVQAGDANGNAYHFQYVNDFSELKSSIDVSNNNINLGQATVSEAIAKYQETHSNINPIDTQNVNQAGIVTFSKDETNSDKGLKPGIYLIRQTRAASGYYKISPFIITIPSIDVSTGHLKYEVEAAQPKVEPVRPIPYNPPNPTQKTVSDQIEVTKKLTGDKPENDTTFEFKLTPEKAGNPMPSQDTAIVDGSGSVKFGSITFRSTGTYKYTVTETKGNSLGYTYDTSSYTITYNIGSGLKITSKTIEKDGKTVSGKDGIVFTNKYETPDNPKPDPDKKIVSADPPVTKIIQPKETNGAMPDQASTFNFTLEPENSAYPMPAGSSSGKKSITTRNQETVEFGKITFDTAGTYTYKVTEEKGNAAGYTYDESIYYIVYVVSSNGDNGLTLKKDLYDSSRKTIVAEDNDNAIFINKYEKPVTPDEPENPSYPVTPNNPATPTTPGTPGTPSTPGGGTPQLPQTGQLWWPVALLAAAGTILIFAGFHRRKQS